MAFDKTTCPISREQFRQKAAKSIPVTINGATRDAVAKEFKTGSLGWNINEKVTLEVDGVKVVCQIGANITIVGSKELPQ